MAKTLSIFYLPNRKLNRRNCNGLTDSSTLQIANDPRIKLIIPEQGSESRWTKKLGNFF